LTATFPYKLNKFGNGNGNVSDEYCLKHILLNKQQLMSHLKIPNSLIPKGYEIDHINPRREYKTDEDFNEINAWYNLRLLPKSDNNRRNWT
jgi:hypothetical protein